MKAITYTSYGSPEKLKLNDVPRPEPKSKEVLIKVLAASVNKADWHILKGEPFPVRLMAGLFRPKFQTPGADIAGIVERVGNEVTRFKPGDEVFAELSAGGFGGFAEYATAEEKLVANKPYNLTFEEAAALPMAAITALQGLYDKGKIKAGQSVLINGASGGVGSYAIQIAKAFGAEVTAVCSTSKIAHALKQGADVIIDYTVQDFTKADKKFDLIFDIVGNHSVLAITRVLKPKGTYVSCAFSFSVMFQGAWQKLKHGKEMVNLLAGTKQADLEFIAKLAEEEKLIPNVERNFTLDDVPEALQQMGNGKSKGKLVITI